MITNELLSINNNLVTWQTLLFMVCTASVILWLWALQDILRSDFKTDIDKLVWVIVVAVLPIVGAVLYFLIGRKQKRDITAA